MNKILFLMLLLGTISCGNKDSSSSKPKPRIDPIETQPLEVTQKETINFVRKKQMTYRYNCRDILVSRKLETLNSLSKKITIDYEGRKTAWSYSAKNRRTRSRNLGLFVKEGKFVVDYAPTLFNMRVRSGINDVAYKFKRCTKIAVDDRNNRYCKGKIVLEKEGIVQLDVYYSLEIIPGERHIKKTPEECKKP